MANPLAALGAAQQSTGAAKATTLSVGKDMADLLQGKEQMIAQALQTDLAAQKEKQAQVEMAETVKLATYKALGVVPGQPEDIVLKLATGMATSLDAAMAAQAKYDAAQSNNVLDDPVKWFTEALAAPQYQEQVKAATASYDLASKALTATNQAVSQIESTYARATEVHTDASRAAELEATARAAQVALADLYTKQGADAIAQANAIATLDSNAASLELQKHQVVQAERAFRLQQAQLRLAQADRSDRKREEAAKRDAAVYDYYLYEQGAREAGLPSLLSAEERARPDADVLGAARLERMKALQNTPMQMQALSGMAQGLAWVNSGGRQSVDSPGTSAYLASQGMNPAFPKDSDAGKLVRTIYNKTQGTPEERIAATNNQLKTQVATNLTDANAKGSVYKLPPLADIIAASPVLTKDPMVAKILLPVLQSGAAPKKLAETDSTAVLDMIASGVRERVITPQQAAKGFVELVRKGIMVANTANRYSKLGIPTPPGLYDTESYKMEWDTDGWGDTTVVGNSYGDMLRAFATRGIGLPLQGNPGRLANTPKE